MVATVKNTDIYNTLAEKSITFDKT